MDLTFDAIAAQVGSDFSFATDSEPLALSLFQADADGRGGGSLLFSGPRSPQLVQGTYSVSGPDDLAGHLFVVPIAATEDTTTYQAIFA